MDIENFNQRIQRNNEYYDYFAPKVKIRSEDRDFAKAIELFLSFADKEKTVLDIGCGAGNHLKIFKDKGYKCLGIEPSREMRRLACNSGEVIDGSFEKLSELVLPSVGGVWCASSILHVPREEVLNVFRSIAQLLGKGNPFYFTVRLGQGSKWDKWDDAKGDISRFIQLYDEKELLETLDLSGFSEINHWVEDSYWGRPSKWISVVAKS